jgi:hypothetical protein
MKWPRSQSFSPPWSESCWWSVLQNLWQSFARLCKILWRTARPLTILLLACGPGCGTRIILVPSGDPVQIREDLEASVWTFDATGTRVPGRTKIPAGWYALPDSPRPHTPP